MQKINVVFLLVILLLISSCNKENEIVKPVERSVAKLPGEADIKKFYAEGLSFAAC